MSKNQNASFCQSEIIKVESLSVNYREIPAIIELNFSIHSGQVVGIIGPNGAGKTTMIKAILNLLPYRGTIKVWNDLISKHLHKVAYVPQHRDIDLNFPISVEDTVMIGRYHYLKRLRRPKHTDREEVIKALKLVRLLDKKSKQIGQLSGGERQRVFLARALAQQAELILLDEPFNGIDFQSQEIIMELLTQQSIENKTLLVVHHDISKATQFFDSAILINETIIAAGKTQEVLNSANLALAYQGDNFTTKDSHINKRPEQEQNGPLVISK